MTEPLFILCPLRSYSSLVCMMLGQHPEMYGLLELNLFLEDSLGDLVRRHQSQRPHAIHGLLRTLAQLQAKTILLLKRSSLTMWGKGQRPESECQIKLKVQMPRRNGG